MALSPDRRQRIEVIVRTALTILNVAAGLRLVRIRELPQINELVEVVLVLLDEFGDDPGAT